MRSEPFGDLFVNYCSDRIEAAIAVKNSRSGESAEMYLPRNAHNPRKSEA